MSDYLARIVANGNPSKLVAALIKAKQEFAPAVKNKLNPHFKSRYVDLAEVIEVTEEALSKNGLAVLQPTRVDDQGRSLLLTVLCHEGGEAISGEYLLKPSKEDPQGYGAALTYARRYAYMAMLGIAPEDDDGNATSRPAKQSERPKDEPAQQQARPEAQTIDTDQAKEIADLLIEARITKQHTFKDGKSRAIGNWHGIFAHYKIDDPLKLPLCHFQDCKQRVKRRDPSILPAEPAEATKL